MQNTGEMCNMRPIYIQNAIRIQDVGPWHVAKKIQAQLPPPLNTPPQQSVFSR